MKIHFSERGRDDCRHWIGADPDMLARVNLLIEDARRRLFTGLGKPEPLEGTLTGWWSRRITGDHRLVCRIAGKPGEDQRIEIAACRYHYE